MFKEAIDRLVRVRRYVDKKVIELQDTPLLSQRLADVSYQLTMSINDLEIVQKAIKEQENE